MWAFLGFGGGNRVTLNDSNPKRRVIKIAIRLMIEFSFSFALNVTVEILFV
jgi:hypothetical protein